VSDEEDFDNPRTSSGRCAAFQSELNSFICQRTKEWDINEYEIAGIILFELFEQLDWFIKGSSEEEEDDEDDEDTFT
jgi:hypothetical protein